MFVGSSNFNTNWIETGERTGDDQRAPMNESASNEVEVLRADSPAELKQKQVVCI